MRRILMLLLVSMVMLLIAAVPAFARHYHTLDTSNGDEVITTYVGGNYPGAWNNALQNWNVLDTEANGNGLRFVETTNASTAELVITQGPLEGTACGSASILGYPGNWQNSITFDGAWYNSHTADEREWCSTHELGHIAGGEHHGCTLNERQNTVMVAGCISTFLTRVGAWDREWWADKWL